jgi:succinate-acetate transporter protein
MKTCAIFFTEAFPFKGGEAFINNEIRFLQGAFDDALIIEAIRRISGWIGVFCGASAIYSAMGQIINGEFGKPLVPLG